MLRSTPGLLKPALQGVLIDTVHLSVSVYGTVDDSNLGPSADQQVVVSLALNDLIEVVSKAVIAGRVLDLQPKLLV